MPDGPWDIAPKRLLNLGIQDRLWCPNCGEVKTRPQRIIDGKPYHSWKCQVPMEQVTVEVILR